MKFVTDPSKLLSNLEEEGTRERDVENKRYLSEKQTYKTCLAKRLSINIRYFNTDKTFKRRSLDC